MRKRICLSISILAVSLLAPCQAGAQQARETASADSIRLFEGVSVGVDLLGAGQRVLSDYGQYEASLRLNLRGRYFPVVELGIGEADADDVTTSVRYKTRAPYGRVGCDFNLLRNKHDLYRLYAGARLAYNLLPLRRDDLCARPRPRLGRNGLLQRYGCRGEGLLGGGLRRHRRDDMALRPHGVDGEISRTAEPKPRHGRRTLLYSGIRTQWQQPNRSYVQP